MEREHLMAIGFTDTEASIYLTLLEHSRLSPNGLHRITGIKRTTIYAAADELAKKGVIQKDESKKSIYYVAHSPQDLSHIISNEKRALREKENAINTLIPQLELLPKSKHYTIPKVQTVSEADIYDFMYRRAPIWTKSMLDINETTWWGFRDTSVMQLQEQQEFVTWYWKQVPEAIHLKVFGNEVAEEASVEDTLKPHVPSRRVIRNLSGSPFTANQWVAGEYIINYVTAQKPHYLVEIRDRLLADNLRSLYRRLWDATS